MDEIAAALAAEDGLSHGAAALVIRGSGGPSGHRFDEFHAGRCAFCEREGEHLVDDHDHETGLLRGYLCRSCNTTEGVGSTPAWVAYRGHPPATIVEHLAYYVGRGWPTGWWLDQRRARQLTDNPNWPGPCPPFDPNPLAGIGLLG